MKFNFGSSLLMELRSKEKMLSTLGARSFCAAAPCLWNSLPAELREIQSLCNFQQLKTKSHLFASSLEPFSVLTLLIYFISALKVLPIQ